MFPRRSETAWYITQEVQELRLRNFLLGQRVDQLESLLKANHIPVPETEFSRTEKPGSKTEAYDRMMAGV
jgi:hypothetical protein